jgi:putative DNA primase/helicase
MTIREQLSHFHGLKGGDGQWSAFCPVCEHEKTKGDRHLALSEGEGGRLLLHCFHGCEFKSIVKMAGLSSRDCAAAGPSDHRNDALGAAKTPAERPQAWPTVEAAITALEQRTLGRCAGRWDYTDSFVVLRFNRADGSKTFRPLHRETNGWVCGDPPGPLPLYGLKTPSAEGLAWVVEGERCCDALAGLGLPAVTSAHGAKLPEKSDWQPLAGRDCVIWPDRDEPGRQYAESVAEILSALDPPAKVRIIDPPSGLPEGGDVCDWLEPLDAKEPEELRQTLLGFADAAQEWVSDADAETPGNLEGVFDRPAAKIMSFAEFAATYPVEDEPVIEGWLRRGQVGTICGASKARKSWLLI